MFMFRGPGRRSTVEMSFAAAANIGAFGDGRPVGQNQKHQKLRKLSRPSHGPRASPHTSQAPVTARSHPNSREMNNGNRKNSPSHSVGERTNRDSAFLRSPRGENTTPNHTDMKRDPTRPSSKRRQDATRAVDQQLCAMSRRPPSAHSSGQATPGLRWPREAVPG
jgi:hypothetical protein